MISLLQKFSSLLLLFSYLTLSAQALGQDAEAQRRGRELLEAGYAADQAGDKGRALELYVESFEVYPSYDVACNLGMVEASLKQYGAAANHLSYCLRHYPTAQSLKQKRVVQDRLQSVKKEVGSVMVRADVKGARVSIAGTEIGVTPMEHAYFLVPGQYGIRMETDDRGTETTFRVEKGNQTSVSLQFEPQAQEPQPEQHVDEKKEAEAPREQTEGRPSLIPTYVMGGVALASFATSMVFRGLASGKRNDIDDLRADIGPTGCTGQQPPSDCDELSRAVSTQRSFSDVSTATWVASGALAAGAVGYLVYALTARPKERSGRLRAVPIVGRRSNGIVLSGSF